MEIAIALSDVFLRIFLLALVIFCGAVLAAILWVVYVYNKEDKDETKMERKIRATSPCAKFVVCSPRDQIQKIKEEVIEVEEALELLLDPIITGEEKEKAALDTVVEMFDVIACVNTLHEQLRVCYPEFFRDGARMAAETYVIHKNMARGYYAPEV